MGSSAITSDGLPDTAMAAITRWRRPPESWCGKTRIRISGSDTPTSVSSRMPSALSWPVSVI